MGFLCPGCGQEFPSEAKRNGHASSCQPYKDYEALEARCQRGEQLTRKELQVLTGVSPSTQRRYDKRYEKLGVKEFFIIKKDESGGLYLNPEKMKIGPRVRLHRRGGL